MRDGFMMKTDKMNTGLGYAPLIIDSSFFYTYDTEETYEYTVYGNTGATVTCSIDPSCIKCVKESIQNVLGTSSLKFYVEFRGKQYEKLRTIQLRKGMPLLIVGKFEKVECKHGSYNRVLVRKFKVQPKIEYLLKCQEYARAGKNMSLVDKQAMFDYSELEVLDCIPF